jgi:predicted membrane-bound spermidine synthase
MGEDYGLNIMISILTFTIGGIIMGMGVGSIDSLNTQNDNIQILFVLSGVLFIVGGITISPLFMRRNYNGKIRN